MRNKIVLVECATELDLPLEISHIHSTHSIEVARRFPSLFVENSVLIRSVFRLELCGETPPCTSDRTLA